MASGFELFEAHLQTFFERLDVFSVKDEKVAILRKIINSLEGTLKSTHDTELKAFHIRIHVSPDEFDSWQNHLDPDLGFKITTEIQKAALATLSTSILNPSISLIPDPTLGSGEISIDIATDEKITRSGNTSVIEAARDETDSLIPNIPENAYLILKDVDQVHLCSPVVNIGRRKDNHIVISDPRVSRRHAQLRAVNCRFTIFDLGSSGGTFVNNTRITQHPLVSGDVVSLAGFIMIYVEESKQGINETDKLTRIREDDYPEE